MTEHRRAICFAEHSDRVTWVATLSTVCSSRASVPKWCLLVVVVALVSAAVMSQALTGADSAQAQVSEPAGRADQLRQIYAELASSGSVDVVVMFDLAEAVSRFGGPPASRAQFSREQIVNLARDGVRHDLVSGVENIADGKAFTSVPAMVVTVATSAELDALASSALVASMTVDDDGGTILTDGTRQIIGADISWAGGMRGAGVRIAVLDTGIDTDHPDLIDAVVHEACFITNADGSPGCNGQSSAIGPGTGEDDNGHGTIVAGVVASDGVVAPRGIAPDVELEVIKMIDDEGIFASSSQMVQALDYVLSSRPNVDVVNIAAGTARQFDTACDADFPAMSAAVASLRARGTIVVSAATNTGSTTMGAPACLADVIAAGATFANPANPTTFDTFATFSSISKMTDVAAPGSTIDTSAMGGGVSTGRSGTSLAVAAVSGCIAIFINQGYLTIGDIEDRMQTSAHFVGRRGLTVPRIDCSPLIMDQSGDITCDGRVNNNDIVAVLEYLVALRNDGGDCPLASTVTSLNLAKADANADTSVRLIDALLLAQS